MIFPVSESAFIGLLGTSLIILTYFLLQVGRLHDRSYRYLFLNLCGSSAIMYSLMHDWNTAGVIINGFWIVISLIGIFRRPSLDSSGADQ